MMFELSIQEDIASAHFLKGHEGKCKGLHGHNWKIEVCVVSDKLDEVGRVSDFAFLKKQLKEFLSGIDHVCLNELDDFKDHNPTTENIAKYIYDHFGKIILPLSLKSVQVWESETSSVKYYL